MKRLFSLLLIVLLISTSIIYPVYADQNNAAYTSGDGSLGNPCIITTSGLMNILFTIGSGTAYVNGSEYKLLAAVFRDEVSDKIMVPLDSFCEMYNIQVEPDSRTANLYTLTKNNIEAKLYVTDDSDDEKVTFTPHYVYGSKGEEVVESSPDSPDYDDEYLVKLYGMDVDGVQYISLELFAGWLGFDMVLNDDGIVKLNELPDSELFEYSAVAHYDNGILTVTRSIENHTPFYIIGYAPDPCEFAATLYKETGGTEGFVCDIAGYLDYPAILIATSVKPNYTKTYEYTAPGPDTYPDTGSLSGLANGNYICRMRSRVNYVFAGFRTVEHSEKTYGFAVDENTNETYSVYSVDSDIKLLKDGRLVDSIMAKPGDTVTFVWCEEMNLPPGGDYLLRLTPKVDYKLVHTDEFGEQYYRHYTFTMPAEDVRIGTIFVGTYPHIYEAYVENGNTIVGTSVINKGIVCAADYDENGALVNFKTVEYSYPAYGRYTAVLEDIEADKVFAWDSLDAMYPLCDAVNVKK